MLISAVSSKSQNDSQIKVIYLATLKSEVSGKDVQLLHVRTSQEYDAGQIDDAINIDVLNEASFAQRIQTLDKEKPVYIYFQMGGRSEKASRKLKNMGFRTTFDYSGGYGEWSK